jgi:hypothetical protein
MPHFPTIFNGSAGVSLYMDDCGIFAHDNKIINKLIQDLQNDAFLLKDKGNIEDFLGIHVECITINSDGSLKISTTQTGLIYSIIEDLSLTTSPGPTSIC